MLQGLGLWAQLLKSGRERMKIKLFTKTKIRNKYFCQVNIQHFLYFNMSLKLLNNIVLSISCLKYNYFFLQSQKLKQKLGKR